MIGLALAGLIVFGGTLSAYAACSNPSPLPSGYAAPCPVFSVSPASVPQSGTLSLSAVPQAGTDYIYTIAYYAKGSTWLPVTLTGNNAAPSYSSGVANGALPASILSTLTPGTNYVVLWDWLWDSTAGCYKGPGLNQCNTGTWRVQMFGLTTAPTGTNLALNRPVVVSSAVASSLPASNAVDGDITTRWAAVATDPQWIYVDLQANCSVSRTVFIWSDYPTAYQIQVSTDAVNWTTVYSTTTGAGGTADLSFPAVSARYVRMYATNHATQWGDSLYEFQIYGGTCTQPTGSPTPTPTPTPTPIVGNCTPGTWSEANQPPVGCRPYPNSLWNKQLPNAGSGGPMTHLASNSDATAQNLLGWTDYANDGNFTNFMAAGDLNVGSTGNALSNDPMYYGRASDPTYKVTNCGNHSIGGASHDPLNTFWHIPNQAQYSGGQSDMFFAVWDQTTNKVLGAYATGVANPKLQSCSATTNATACPMFPMNACSMADYTTDPGYLAGGGAGDSLGNAPDALYIRNAEWIWPTAQTPDYKGIKHALYLNTNCENGSIVFPGGPYHAHACTAGEMGGNGLAAAHGNLFFLDYTDAQIAAMNIPNYQKSIIWTMSHYGGYQGDTDGSTNRFLVANRPEADEAYFTAGVTNPLFAWLTSQGIGHHANGTTSQVYQLLEWNNIPLLTGPNCPASTCRISMHAHIADPCVAKTLAGVSGGC